MSQIYFEEDNDNQFENTVFQTMKLLNFSVVPRQSIMENSEEEFITNCVVNNSEKSLQFEHNDSQPFCDLFQKLENDIVHTKEKEILVLLKKLEIEKQLRKDAEEKRVKITKYLVLLHHNIGKLISNLHSMFAKKRRSSTFLKIGPFRDQCKRDRFFKEFRALTASLGNGKVDDFFGTIVSLKLLNQLIDESTTTNADRKQGSSESSNSNNENFFTCRVFSPNETQELSTTAAEPIASGVSTPTPVVHNNGNNSVDSTNLARSNNNNSILLQLLRDTSSSPSSNPTTLVESRHIFDNAKRDPHFFYCTCGVKFSRDKYSDLNNHIKYYSKTTSQKEHETRKRSHTSIGGSNDTRRNGSILKCTQCGEYFYNSSSLLEHCVTVHVNVSTEVGQENLHCTQPDEFSEFLASNNSKSLSN